MPPAQDGKKTEVRLRASMHTSLRLGEALTRAERLYGRHLTEGDALRIVVESWMKVSDKELLASISLMRSLDSPLGARVA